MELNGHQAPSGEVAQGYDRVLEVFGAGDVGDGGAAFSAYVDGEKVVDVWRGWAQPGMPWSRDTMTTLMSSTKGLTALCAQILYDRGLLDLDAPVAEYWPEFAQAGKEHALVRQVLNHTVGVVGFNDPGTLLDWSGKGWDDHDAIAARLAAQPPAWTPGTKIGYHAISSGWMTGELVRRIAGVTIGEFLRTEICQPLAIDPWIGTPREHQDRMADVITESTKGLPDELVELERVTRAMFHQPGSLMSLAAITMHGRSLTDDLGSFMNLPRVRGLEIAAANGSGTARDLARAYAMLAMGGELDGVRIVSADAVERFSAPDSRGRSALSPEIVLSTGEVVPPVFTCYGQGYACNLAEPGQPPVLGPTERTYGHAGHGGQFGFCDPVHHISVGFVRNHLTLSPELGASLVNAIYECAGVSPSILATP